MLMRRHLRSTVALLGALAIGASSTTACAANVGVTTPTPTATAAISGTITINRPAPPPTLTPPPTVAPRLNVNTASVNQMRAAFAAAGILGAVEWANAIEDGRPYPPEDATWSKLRDVLAKAGAPSASVDQVILLLVR